MGNYLIANKTFKSKNAIKKHITDNILYSYKYHQSISQKHFDFMVDVILMHPESGKKIGTGIANIHVRQNTEFGKTSNGFWIKRTDGTFAEIGIHSCIDGDSNKKRFHKACRNAITEYIISFRLNYFDKYADGQGCVKCQETGDLIQKEQSHVDHLAPDTFINLVTEFVLENKINIENVVIDPHFDGVSRYRFVDKDLIKDFYEFHKKNCNLVIVKAEVNLGRPRK